MTSELRALDENSPSSDARFSEAHHRIANNLALVAGFVRLQASGVRREGRPLSAEEVSGVLQDVGARIETIGRLHRLLSRDPGSDVIDACDYLRDTCQALGESMGADADTSVRFDSQCVWRMPADQAGPLALIVTELITNAIKYAHPSGLGGVVRVQCRPGPHGAMTVSVADDGVGLPERFDPHVDGGLGMRVVRSLAQQLRGELSFESDGLGLTVSLSLPRRSDTPPSALHVVTGK